jgi:hypothetical protein
MGREATCTLRYRNRSSTGKLLLETDELLFRGEPRLRIPLAAIRHVTADGEALEVTFADGVARFLLGPAAEKWAKAIASPKSLLDKLGVKPGARVSVVGVTDDAFRAELAERAGEVADGRPRKESDLVFFGAEERAALARLGELARYLKRDGGLWVVYPKGAKAITEADVLAAGKPAGLVDVKVVRFSATHTGHKFVIPVAARR